MKPSVSVAAAAFSMVLAACAWDSGSGPTLPTIDPSSESAALGTDAGSGEGSHTGGQDARDAGHNAEGGAFGASCAAGIDCESNVCFLGGKGGFCSLSCTSDAECPPGADGTQHCNPHGDCRY